jgi:hypothetical protein
MKILKQFTKWWNKTGEGNKKTKDSFLSDYTPSKDIYQQIRNIQNEAKKKYEQNSDRIKSMSTYNSNYSIGHMPGSTLATGGWVSSPITSSNLSSSAITIDGGINGSMRVDVPLIVNGRDIVKELDEMRDALLLLRRDVDMEAKYPRLKELKEEYEAALAKYKTFDTLKESK